ncbi:unnamed protein product [Cylindrotheca closterium]|uniref:Uncharacterized protein n=1 Tax=Cylindrotheca closterium TaxID=2856 RepID=A0AAD2CSP8_9STRA|nr:unnamed protein product [Cylindrotheca closterium]
MLWKLETSELYGELVDMDSAWQLDDEDDDDWDSDSDAPSSASKDPIIIQSIEEGPVYSIDKHGQTVAAVVGQTVLVWEFWSSNGACLIPIKTLSLPGDYQETLYTVSLSDDFLVSAGLGECLFVWTTDTWDLVHTVSVARTKESCLATCCVMTSNWMPNEKGVLACGGYDGCISLWRLAHRLESEG